MADQNWCRLCQPSYSTEISELSCILDEGYLGPWKLNLVTHQQFITKQSQSHGEMTFFLSVPIYSVGKADEQMIQELFHLKVRTHTSPTSELVLIRVQEADERANRIKDDIDCLII